MTLKQNDEKYGTHYSMTLRVKPAIGTLLEETANRLGMSKTAVLVAALHDYSRKAGVSVRASGLAPESPEAVGE